MGRGRPGRSSSSTQPTCSRELVGRRVGEDAVGEPRGAPDRRLGATADEDRDPGLAASGAPRGSGGWYTSPSCVNGSPLHACGRIREDLLHGRAATAHVGAQAGVFDLGPAQPQPERQPAMAQQLDGRRVLRQAQRVMHRREDDAGADLDPRGRLGERRADDEQRGHVAVIDEVVLRRPDRGEAEPLRVDREAERVVVGATSSPSRRVGAGR